ncbi:MAG: (2Fe-2S)-binding protein [Cardiobacteriaceae bacterium]|nr:(2Fe-2S)-binding protein [Cardiobacteriaceae bacterium]
MYICICRAISEKKVKESVKEGKKSIKELCNSLGAGNECGKCLPVLAEIVQKEKKVGFYRP